MVQAYKFSPTASDKKPDTDITRLLEAVGTRELTRQEKDRIAYVLYGPGTAGGGTYKLSGWMWPMVNDLPRILVRFDHTPSEFWIYYAPDKTSLRRALRTKILEMIQA